MVVARGTTAVVCDPHEIANVLGVDGVHWLLDASAGLPLRVFAMAPSCVPASALESPRGPLGPDEMAAILRHERAIGVAEMMDFPAVIAGDPAVLAKLALHAHVDGHAPGVTGPALDAYAAAGIRSDHESTTWEEALEKRRRGTVGAAARGVQRAQPERAARAGAPARARVLRVLHRRPRAGHAGARGPHRRACAAGRLRRGSRPRTRSLMATLHPARCHGLAELGAIAPGFHADMVLLDGPRVVPRRGRDRRRRGRRARRAGARRSPAPPVPGWVRDSVHAAPLGRRRIRPRAGRRARARDRDRPGPADHRRGAGAACAARRAGRRRPGARPRQARGRRAPPRARAASASGSCAASACAAARSPRPSRTTRTTSSSPASTTRACSPACGAWSSWAAGSRSRATASCAASWRCRSPGLLSEQPAEAVVERLDELLALLRAQGVAIEAPFMTLSFLALSVIPELKLTDRGLVDVVGARIVALRGLSAGRAVHPGLRPRSRRRDRDAAGRRASRARAARDHDRRRQCAARQGDPQRAPRLHARWDPRRADRGRRGGPRGRHPGAGRRRARRERARRARAAGAGRAARPAAGRTSCSRTRSPRRPSRDAVRDRPAHEHRRGARAGRARGRSARSSGWAARPSAATARRTPSSTPGSTRSRPPRCSRAACRSRWSAST